MLSKTYVQACLDGDANIFDLDDYIDYWHDNDTGVTLREFLGLTPYEYQEWGKNSDSIFRDILRCRREGIDFAEYERKDLKGKQLERLNSAIRKVRSGKEETHGKEER